MGPHQIYLFHKHIYASSYHVKQNPVPLAMAKPKFTKGRILQTLTSLYTRLANIKEMMMMKRRNKVGPMSSSNYKGSTEIMALSDGLSDLDRWDDEYLQARRAILSSYHLSNHDGGGRSLKQKMKSSLKGLCRDVGKLVRARAGVRVYRFTVAGNPWTRGRELAFRCFLPHLKRIRHD